MEEQKPQNEQQQNPTNTENVVQQDVGQKAAGVNSNSPQTSQQTETNVVPNKPAEENNSIYKSLWFWVIILLLILLGIGLAFLWIRVIPSLDQRETPEKVSNVQQQAPVTDRSQQNQPTLTKTGNNRIVVEDQMISQEATLRMDEVELNENAFLAVRMPSAGQGEEPGLMIASTPILGPDVYEDLDVPTFIDRPDLITKSQIGAIKAGGPAYAILYRDVDGNQVFDGNVDNVPLKDSQGEDIRVEFTILGVEGQNE